MLTLSAVTGFPPVVAMPVIMAPSRMRTWVFSLVCLLGMTARFVVLALVIDGVADSLLPH